LDETIAPSGWWSASGVPTGPGLDPADGDCQSVVGSAKNSRRVTEAWNQDFWAERFALDASSSAPPSQTWHTFLTNHLNEIASVDLFTVPTATFRVLFCLVVLRHERRTVLHFNVTNHPTAQWAAQQLVEAFPEAVSVRYLVRDRDRIYGDYFRQRVRGLGLKEVLSAPRSPWQNAYLERLIASIRLGCWSGLRFASSNSIWQ
jgi:transposase InsO family protein